MKPIFIPDIDNKDKFIDEKSKIISNELKMPPQLDLRKVQVQSQFKPLIKINTGSIFSSEFDSQLKPTLGSQELKIDDSSFESSQVEKKYIKTPYIGSIPSGTPKISRQVIEKSQNLKQNNDQHFKTKIEQQSFESLPQNYSEKSFFANMELFNVGLKNKHFKFKKGKQINFPDETPKQSDLLKLRKEDKLEFTWGKSTVKKAEFSKKYDDLQHNCRVKYTLDKNKKERFPKFSKNQNIEKMNRQKQCDRILGYAQNGKDFIQNDKNEKFNDFSMGEKYEKFKNKMKIQKNMEIQVMNLYDQQVQNIREIDNEKKQQKFDKKLISRLEQIHKFEQIQETARNETREKLKDCKICHISSRPKKVKEAPLYDQYSRNYKVFNYYTDPTPPSEESSDYNLRFNPEIRITDDSKPKFSKIKTGHLSRKTDNSRLILPNIQTPTGSMYSYQGDMSRKSQAKTNVLMDKMKANFKKKLTKKKSKKNVLQDIREKLQLKFLKQIQISTQESEKSNLQLQKGQSSQSVAQQKEDLEQALYQQEMDDRINQEQEFIDLIDKNLYDARKNKMREVLIFKAGQQLCKRF